MSDIQNTELFRKLALERDAITGEDLDPGDKLEILKSSPEGRALLNRAVATMIPLINMVALTIGPEKGHDLISDR